MTSYATGLSFPECYEKLEHFFHFKQVEFRETGAHQVNPHSVQEKSLKSGGKNLLVICRSDAAAKLFNLEDNLVSCFVFCLSAAQNREPQKKRLDIH